MAKLLTATEWVSEPGPGINFLSDWLKNIFAPECLLKMYI